MDLLRTSELDEPDPSSPVSHFSSECDEPDTGSDFSPPLKRKFTEKPPSKIVISPASSSSVCVPDSESDSECEELSPGRQSTSSYLSRLQADLECHPLEEQSGGPSEVNPQSENVHSSITIDDMTRSESAASESGDFPSVASLSSYHKRRQTDLECQPLEELSEDQRDLNPQFEDELSMTTDATNDATSSESLITENIFSGETVFLYFDSNIPESRQHDIRKQLRFQGASVSQFFDKKVSVVLANKGAAKNISCEKGLFNQRTLSRGASMVRQALERNSNKGIKTNEKSKFIQRAEMNGIRVVYIEDVRLGVRTLRPPFLKVEDHSRKYRPLILEMTKWPNLEDMFRDDSTCNETVYEQKKQEINKYCGLCEQYFTNYKVHINSSLHQKNAKDDAKWKHVDTLIARGPTLAEMEERLLRKKAEMQGGKP